MYPHQFDRLNEVLNVLAPAADRLPGNAPQFVRDTVERAKKWGADVFLSPKQINWLESLYAQETGATFRILAEPTTQEARSDVLGDDERGMDDSIPF